MSRDTYYASRIRHVEVHEVHSNLTAEVIEITSEKLEIILREHVDCLAREREWQAPLGILVTILVVLLTTNFKASFGLSADTWTAFFLLCFAVSGIWLVSSLVRRRRSLSVHELLDKVKNKS